MERPINLVSIYVRLTNISNALFVSGGVNKQGSLRNIQIKREDKVIATMTFTILLRGSTSSDLKLQDGDIVFIPFIENKVELEVLLKDRICTNLSKEKQLVMLSTCRRFNDVLSDSVRVKLYR